VRIGRALASRDVLREVLVAFEREVVEGGLSTPAQVVLPVAAGIGGMVVPRIDLLPDQP
jgi:Na+/H+ antiporter NhaA